MNRQIYALLLAGSIATVYMVSCTPEPAPIPKPTLQSFEPKTATRGEPVKITGDVLYGISQVSFGGVPADSFKIRSQTEIIAYPGNGASGNVSVTGAGGTAEAAGFTYYTPQSFKLTGTAQWSTLSAWPAMDSSGYKFFQGVDSGSLTIRKINRYDTPRIRTEHPHPVFTYADSAANYVLLSGVVYETPRQIPNSSVLLSFYQFTAASVSTFNVFAKITDTLIVIPRQYPAFGLYIQGSGTLKDNKLALKYTIDYRGNSKNAVLTSQ